MHEYVQLFEHRTLFCCWFDESLMFVLFSWEITDSKSEYRLRLNQCLEEAMMSFTIFLQEMSHFKEQNPGKVK